MSTSVCLGLSHKQNHEQHVSSKSLRFNTHRVLRPAGSSNLGALDGRQISEQLKEECSLIESLIQDYNLRIEVQGIPRKSCSSIQQDFLRLQEAIRSKDQQISRINQEIQSLKLAKGREAHSSSRQYRKSEDPFTLAEELQGQRLELKELMQIHHQKMNSHKMLSLAIKRLEKLYEQKFPNREANYELFKERELENRREEQKKRKRDCRSPSIRDRLDYNAESSALTRSEDEPKNENRSMKQLQDKKRIAQLAIRNARKKHHSEISELNAKLEFLRDENALLNQKIRQTELERIHLMDRFKLNKQQRIRSKERRFTLQSSLS